MQTTLAGSGPAKIWEPKDWEEVWNKIDEFRKVEEAPCDKYGKYKWAGIKEDATPEEQKFHCLVGIMLSGQNSDYSTYHALKKFVEDGNCNFETIEETPAEEMWQSMIPNVRHNFAKVQYLKKAVNMIKTRFGGEIPSTFRDLKMLSGVGTKMAHTYLQLMENKVEGISANTHVHRLAARLDWCREPAADANATARMMQEWLPEDKWSEVESILTGLGQQVCHQVRPRCDRCPVQDKCPYFEKYGNGRMGGENQNNERMTKKKWDALRAKKTFEQNTNEMVMPSEYEPPAKKRKAKELPQSKLVEYEVEDEEKSKIIPKPRQQHSSDEEEEEEKTSQEEKLDQFAKLNQALICSKR